MIGNQRELSKRKTAIVIGGSIAGMLAARVLSDSFEKVMIIEKDGEQPKGSPRKGVPQAAQGHVLLKSGEKILEDLFPGLRAEMIKGGSVPADFANDIAWHHHGSWKIRYNSGCSIIQQSRPFLEYHLCKRIDQIENIHTLYNTKVIGFTLNDSRITGVEAENAEGNAIYPADLTVDASGANSLAFRCLEKLGMAQPKKTEISINLYYANRIYRRLRADPEWKSLLVYPNPPRQSFGGAASPTENNDLMITLFGYGANNPPADNNEFLETAKSLEKPHIYDCIKNGEPVSDIKVYRFPSMRRYHFEKMKTFPKGLLVMGDAFCRMDPVFAQGMSIAAKEAKALQEILISAGEADPYNFHRKISKIVDIPWLIALTEDFRFSHTAGAKPWGLPLLQWYVKKVVNACSFDPYTYDCFMKVLHLQAHPAVLFTPRAVWNIFRGRKK
ncbi:FAD-dependent oxidoreductase [Cytobacillus firmus]|uniref:FAD-binding domain-containing protein n=1 Tax=Cytobacillus firmus DS1 TaxID=1307436 RepID=W7KV40_CYTFI|nr:FAD-dependent monooxygenase [Cytobacillus firmus]EWG11345.1 hypothetical protein PBF_09982 [Cytobacillus firmus DS1]